MIEPFYIINNSSQKMYCLFKTVNKQSADYLDIKVD